MLASYQRPKVWHPSRKIIATDASLRLVLRVQRPRKS